MAERECVKLGDVYCLIQCDTPFFFDIIGSYRVSVYGGAEQHACSARLKMQYELLHVCRKGAQIINRDQHSGVENLKRFKALSSTPLSLHALSRFNGWLGCSA